MVRVKRGINAFGGNMPFLGGRRIATQYGERYADWLTEVQGGTGGTDYVGYFFHRAAEMLTPAGAIGFIATDAIADGENRRSILGALVSSELRFHIYAAETGKPWPGTAHVLVSTIHLERGLPEQVTSPRRLDGRNVTAINSRLRSGDEWPEPQPLAENAGLALVGCFLRGGGFILERDEAETFLAAHAAEAEVVRPFLIGDDLTNTPEQQAQRYVIDFADWTLEQAQQFPHADAEHRKYWWRFANVRKELREQTAGLGRSSALRIHGEPGLLATARLSKHSTFAVVPGSWTPSEQVVVFPLPAWTAFAVLQSRVHGIWVALQATHMGEGLRYSASECFVPFPFPERDPKAVLPELESIGERVYAERASFMQRRGLGLTDTYNALTNPAMRDLDVVRLRELHEEMDRAVLDAYGWNDVAVPPYAGTHPDFDDALGARLFALNVSRAALGSALSSGEAPVRKARAARSPGLRKARASVDVRKTTRKRGSG